MTSKEAFKAIGEIMRTSKDKKLNDHLVELSERILQKEVPSTESNTEADQAWWESTHPKDE